MKLWAWLAALAAVCLVLASSTALYAINSSVKLGLPWWTAVAAPALVYALVLPLCVPRIRLAGWVAGFFMLVILHGVLGLATTWLYAQVGLTSFEEALAPAFWGFPPALVLEMVGSLLIALPFLSALAPRPAAPRVQPETSPLRDAAPKRPRPEVPTVPAESRGTWARQPEPPPAAPAIMSAVPPPVTAVAPVVEAPPVEAPPVAAPEQHVVHAAPLAGTNGSASEAAEPAVEAVPDFRQALSELFGTPVSETKVDAETVPEPPPAPAIPEASPSQTAEPPTWTAPAAKVDPPPVAEEPAGAPAVAAAVVRIPFERVVGQLPPGAFRVPLAQVGARLREAEILLVAQGLIVPQLGEGVVQVAWEEVVEQFPAAVFAVTPAEVKERIVNGRLLLPLDEIVKQLPPDVFGASMGRGPVEVPGIESFPAPFKPLGWEEPAPAPASVAPVAEPFSPAGPVQEVELVRAVEPVVDATPLVIEVPSAAEVAEDLKSAFSAEAQPIEVDRSAESIAAPALVAVEPVVEPEIEAVTPPLAEVVPVEAAAVVRIPFARVLAQFPPGAFRAPLEQVGARLRQPETLLVPQELIVPQLGEGAVYVAWEVIAEQFPADVFAVAPTDVKGRIEDGRLALPLDEIVRQLPPDVFGSAMALGPVQVPGIESFPAPFKPIGSEELAPPPVAVEPVIAAAKPEAVVEAATTVATPIPPEPVTEIAAPEVAVAPQPVPVAPLYEAQAFERPAQLEPPPVPSERRGYAERVAALMAPLDTAALDEVRIGDFTIISVSTAGIQGKTVAATAGRLSPLMAGGAPQPIEQATLRGPGGMLVLTPVGSGWSSGAALAVGMRSGGALARLELLARRAARQETEPSSVPVRSTAPFARLEATPTPPVIAAAVESLTTFGPLGAESYREPASGALVHCLVSPGVRAAELAPFAWELAQAMAQSAPAEALGGFHSAALRSGSTRVEIRRLPSAAGLALILVVGGADTGRPGLARLQIERIAARLSVA